jgi:1-acyl-sn-glycerol-3-phosphate acyltransferase
MPQAELALRGQGKRVSVAGSHRQRSAVVAAMASGLRAVDRAVDRALNRLRLLACGTGCLLAAVPCTLLMPAPLTLLLTRRYQREELARRLHLAVPWARFCCRRILGIELLVDGRDRLPRPSQGYMFVANHQSWADIMVLGGCLETAAFLSKDLIRWIPGVGAGAYACGTVYVNRRAKDSRQVALDETLRMCRQSTAVVVFPEGTRSADGELRSTIHRGALLGAHRQGLRVLPVGLDGTHRVLPKSMDRVRRGQRVAVSIGEALSPSDYPDPKEWCDAVWGRVAELFLRSRARLGQAGLRATTARQAGGMGC